MRPAPVTDAPGADTPAAKSPAAGAGSSPTARCEPLDLVPVGLRVEGRRVLVVGAGRIAARKATPYLRYGAEVLVVAPEHDPAMDALDVAERRYRPFQPTDLDDVWLAVTATGLPAVDGEVFVEAERRRIWCNAADDFDHCSVVLPAVAAAGPFVVSISSGGTSPASASWLRRRIERLLDDDTVQVATVAAEVRDRVRAAGFPTEVPGWAEVLDGPALDLVRRGRADELAALLWTRVTGGAAGAPERVRQP